MTTMKRIVAVLLAVMLVASIGLFSVSATSAKLTLDATGDSAAGFTFTIYRVATLEDLTTGEYDIEATDEAVVADMAKPNQAGAAFLADLKAADESKVGTSLGTLSESTMEITDPGIYYVKVTGTPSTVTAKEDSVIVWPQYANDQYTMSDLTVDLSQKVNSGTDNVTKFFTDDKTADSKSLAQGDVVSFTLEADVVGSSTEQLNKFVIWDKMSLGLTYNNDLKVYYDDSTVASTSDFTISAVDNEENEAIYGGGKVITITAKAATLSGTTFYSHDKVRVEYSATVNNSATTGANYNGNKDGLTYNTGSGNDVEKAGREVKVYTYEAYAVKINGDTEAPLQGAKFGLYKGSDKIAEATSGRDGKLVFKASDSDENAIRLAPGSYSLKEIEAPSGYALSTAETSFTIADDKTGQTYENGVCFVGSIANYPTKLPATGGIGNTLFIIIGGCLVLLAGAMFVIIMKKRASSK